jgi:hypothetical protein
VADPAISEIVEEYRSADRERAKGFPPKGTKCILQARDGTQAELTFYQLQTIRTKTVGDLFINQKCPDYSEGYVDYIAGELRYRRSKGYDTVMLITGEVRTGKSTLAQKLALKLKPDLGIEQTVFKIEDLDNAIKNSHDGDVIVLDECIDLHSKEWWDSFQIKLIKKLEIMGILHLTLILVLPHRLTLNKDLRDERVKYWIDVKSERGSLRRGFATVRECVPNEWYKDPFWDTLATFHFTELNGEYWDVYSKKKLAFVREMNDSDYLTKGKKNDSRNRVWKKLHAEGKTHQEIADLFDVGRSTVTEGLAQ